MARTTTARLPWMIRTRFSSLRNSSNSSRKQIFEAIFLFYHEIVCCMYSLESPRPGDSNEYTQTYQHFIEDPKNLPKIIPIYFLTLHHD